MLEVLDRGSTKRWVAPNTPTIVLDAEDTRWMLKAATIGLHTGRHSHIFDDELQKTVAKHEHNFPRVPDGAPGWFIRTERVSLKYTLVFCGKVCSDQSRTGTVSIKLDHTED